MFIAFRKIPNGSKSTFLMRDEEDIQRFIEEQVNFNGSDKVKVDRPGTNCWRIKVYEWANNPFDQRDEPECTVIDIEPAESYFIY
jgi:hypothetical protein